MANKLIRCTKCKQVVEYRHKHKPELCPFCQIFYWDKPEDERVLFLIQDEYVKNDRHSEILGKMYPYLLSYAENIIKHKISKNGHNYIMEESILKEKANDIALIVIERYLKRPDVKIEFSFGGMMLRIANGVLFGDKKEDREESLNKQIYDNDEIIERIYSLTNNDYEENKTYDPQENLDRFKTNILQDIDYIISKSYEKIKKKKSSQNLYYLLGLYHFFSSSKENFKRDFYGLINNSTKRNIEYTKLIVRNHIKNEGM